MTPQEIVALINATLKTGQRKLVALVGPPASGKSTLAQALADLDPKAAVVPMDGFHLDNALIEPRGLLARKGSPDTFDAAGFLHLVRRLGTEADVTFPLFDRGLDKSINAAGHLGPETETVIVEGNYLLLDRPIWDQLPLLWDYSIRLDVAKDQLENRLIQRWRDYGLSEQAAQERAQSNDLINARSVQDNSLPADLVLSEVRL
ncbi:MAG: hypothetical protein ABJL67_18700 [Sulfitobacter sp.]